MSRRLNFGWLKKFVQEERPTIRQLEEEISKRTGQNGAEVVRRLFQYGWLDKNLKWHD